MKARVIEFAQLCYGTEYKARISLNQNQLWDVVSVPDEARPMYILNRRGVSIDIPEKDYRRLFREVGE